VRETLERGISIWEGEDVTTTIATFTRGVFFWETFISFSGKEAGGHKGIPPGELEGKMGKWSQIGRIGGGKSRPISRRL